jgi:hypothetical protein
MRTLRNLHKSLLKKAIPGAPQTPVSAPPANDPLAPTPTVAQRKPVATMPGWNVGYDHKNEMIHFNHDQHGTVSVKKNPNVRSATSFPYVVTHNSGSVGRYQNPAQAIQGAQAYGKKLSLARTPQTRMFNMPSGEASIPGPTSPTLQTKIKKSASAYFHEMLHKAHEPFVCLLNLDEELNESLNKAIQLGLMDSLAKAKKPAKEAAPIEPPISDEAEAAKPAKAKIRHYRILTDEGANAKTAKNINRQGFVSAILHLTPADLAGSGQNMCPGSSEGCRQSCLNTAGRGGMIGKDTNTNTVQDARVRRTLQLVQNPEAFFKDLDADLHKLKRTATAEGKTPVARLNGTSDVDWAEHRPAVWGGKNVFEAHPEISFYDYTKVPTYAIKNKQPNYHVLFSRSEKNQNVVTRMLGLGHNVAVVFGGKKLPEKYLGHPVVPGDDHDLRFLDPRGGYVIGLKAKGDAKSDKSGFVVYGHEGDPTAQPKATVDTKYDRIKRTRAALRAKYLKPAA